MKLKRPKTTIAVVLGIAIAAWVIFAPRDDGPYHEGKSLGEWLDTRGNPREPSPGFEQAEKAIRAIGTNAVPFLVKWLEHRTPPWRVKLYEITPARFRSKPTLRNILLGRGWVRAQSANNGFTLLGTNAASAIPQLEALMNNTNTADSDIRAIIALSDIGLPALPALTNALANPQYPWRDVIVHQLSLISGKKNRDLFLPIFAQLLTDPDPTVRAAATREVRRIAPEILTNTPAN